MNNLKTFEGFFKDMTRQYVPMDMWDEIDKHEGETLSGTVISKRIKKSIFGDKYLLGVEFDEGFTDEIPFDYPIYSKHNRGDRMNVEF